MRVFSSLGALGRYVEARFRSRSLENRPRHALCDFAQVQSSEEVGGDSTVSHCREAARLGPRLTWPDQCFAFPSPKRKRLVGQQLAARQGCDAYVGAVGAPHFDGGCEIDRTAVAGLLRHVR